MPMKQKQTALPLLAALAFVLALAGCEGDADVGSGYIETKLHGTWETHDKTPSPPYGSGTLVIDWDTITITGYNQTYYGLKESERPFKGITKGVPRKAYSEDGKIYINDFGWKEGIAYEYDAGMYPYYTKLLRFTFGGRAETLKKTDG
jgi:hypothetical protein